MTPEMLKILKMAPITGEYIFTFNGKKQTDVKTQWNKLREKLRKRNFLNKKNIKFNDIRRTVGSWLGQNGVNSKIIAEVLGQVDIRSTERYVRFQMDHLKKVLENLPNSVYTAN